MARHVAIVELAVRLESPLKIVGQDSGRDNLLAFDGLRAGLGIVLAHIGVVGGTETNRRLLSFMAHIDTDQHGLGRNLISEGHAPEVTAELGVHLTDDVQEDTVIILGNSAVSHELRDDGTVTVDLVLEEGVEVLMVGVVGHNDKEDEIGVFNGAI